MASSQAHTDWHLPGQESRRCRTLRGQQGRYKSRGWSSGRSRWHRRRWCHSGSGVGESGDRAEARQSGRQTGSPAVMHIIQAHQIVAPLPKYTYAIVGGARRMGFRLTREADRRRTHAHSSMSDDGEKTPTIEVSAPAFLSTGSHARLHFVNVDWPHPA